MKGLLFIAGAIPLALAAPADALIRTTITTRTTIKPTTSCTLTICADYINSCGLGYGGCYAACPGIPTPTFTPPPCPTTTKTKKTRLPTTTVCTQTICIDKVNECGRKYGGCVASCPGMPAPTFSKPPCPSTTTTKTTTATPKPTCGCFNDCTLNCKTNDCICPLYCDAKYACPTTTSKVGPTPTPAFCGGIANISCPTGYICVDNPNDSCDPRKGGADCGGICVKPTKSTTATPKPTPTRALCGGLTGIQCAKGQICVDDPNAPCGLAADCPGICVTPDTFCGGFAGFSCPVGLTCIDDPRDDCDPYAGGADCGGICV